MNQPGTAQTASGGRAGSDDASIGARLRRARERRGIGVRELGRRIGVSASLVSQIELGRATPSVSTLYALVLELDVSMDALFDEASDPQLATVREHRRARLGGVSARN